MKEINEDREEHCINPFKDKNDKNGGSKAVNDETDDESEDTIENSTNVENIKTKEVTVSTTDP